jgi:Domain of unknown function (DUF4396)
MRVDSLNRIAAAATLHCLIGCAIGEVVGLVIGTAAGLGNPATIALSVLLAFGFGYSLTLLPLLRAGLGFGEALPLAFASDSFSIAVMEIVDTAVMLTVPGAMDAGLGDALFWASLALALAVAFVAAFPVNRALIRRGRGHAAVHAHHGHGDASAPSSPGSSRAILCLGAASVVVTVVVTTGSALVVESRRGGSHADAAYGVRLGSVAAPRTTARTVQPINTATSSASRPS